MASHGERRMNERLQETPRLGLQRDEGVSEDDSEEEAEAGAVSGFVDQCEFLSLAGGIEGGGFKVPAAGGGEGGGRAEDLAGNPTEHAVVDRGRGVARFSVKSDVLWTGEATIGIGIGDPGGGSNWGGGLAVFGWCCGIGDVELNFGRWPGSEDGCKIPAGGEDLGGIGEMKGDQGEIKGANPFPPTED